MLDLSGQVCTSGYFVERDDCGKIFKGRDRVQKERFRVVRDAE